MNKKDIQKEKLSENYKILKEFVDFRNYRYVIFDFEHDYLVFHTDRMKNVIKGKNLFIFEYEVQNGNFIKQILNMSLVIRVLFKNTINEK